MSKGALILPFLSTSASNSPKTAIITNEVEEEKRKVLEAYLDGKITLNGIMDTMYKLGRKQSAQNSN